jgi:hypothetical protein
MGMREQIAYLLADQGARLILAARVEDVTVVRPGGGEPLTRDWQELSVVG